MIKLFGILFGVLFGGAVSADPLTVFAPASLQGVLNKVNQAFEEEVRVVYAGSSVLARQILLGAPADVFISASPEWMDEIERNGQIANNSRQDLLTNSLVVIGQGKGISSLRELPYQLAGNRLAVALTDAVPAGIYARQALESAGVWEQLRPHLAETDNVRSAAVLVDRGEVPFGIVYETDVQLFQNLTIAYRIPSTGHDPIVYPIGAISGGHQSAEAYISYLMNSTSSQVFRDFGFGVAP